MPKQYAKEVVEKARSLYCKFGGKDFDAIEREMRKEYPTWRKQNLKARGKGSDSRLGWIDEYQFDKSLVEYAKTQIVAVTDDVQKLYLGIKKTRETLELKVAGEGATPTRDEIYAYRDFCKLEMEARGKLDLTKDNYESFVACFEKMLTWLPEIDEKAATAFLSNDVAEQILERARVEYGEEKQSAA